MAAEDTAPGCQLEQHMDIYTPSSLAAGCLNQALATQDQQNIIHHPQ